MKALCLDKPGPIESLYLTDREEPKPKADEIRVKVRAVGLNPVDYKIARTGHPAWQFPFILGLDVAGIIDSVGENVRELSPGQRVVYHGDLSKPGGFAQYAVTTARAVSVIPEQLSFTDAAALPCAGYTAFQAIHKKLKVESGKSILIHGGAGGVGGFALQLSRLANLKVFTTCSKRNFEYVMSLGADQAIDYNTEDVAAQIKAATGGRGPDYILDTAGPESATASLAMLPFGGALVCCAGFPDFSKIIPFKSALSIHEVALGGAHLSGDHQAQQELAYIGTRMLELAVSGSLNCLVEEIISLEEIPAGLKKLAERHTRGKIVAKLGD